MSSDGTKVLACTCTDKFQDERYGPGQRVHNKTEGKAGDRNIYRCTICGKEK